MEKGQIVSVSHESHLYTAYGFQAGDQPYCLRPTCLAGRHVAHGLDHARQLSMGRQGKGTSENRPRFKSREVQCSTVG